MNIKKVGSLDSFTNNSSYSLSQMFIKLLTILGYTTEIKVYFNSNFCRIFTFIIKNNHLITSFNL